MLGDEPVMQKRQKMFILKYQHAEAASLEGRDDHPIYILTFLPRLENFTMG